MSAHKLRLVLGAPVDDDRDYFAEISVDAGAGEIHTWAEVHLEDIVQSATGSARVERARPIVRMWIDDAHFDVPYSDLVAMLDRARMLLLIGESLVKPDENTRFGETDS